MSIDLPQMDCKETTVVLRELLNVLKNNIDGDIVEFGCYLGETSVKMAKLIEQYDKSKKLYVYDSFEGLPEKTVKDNSPLGESFKAGELLASKKQFIKNIQRANVPMPIIKKAWFSDLTDADVPDRICFAFLDGDYYQSIKDSFKLIEHKLSKNAVIIVDDYVNPSLPGASKAVDEWLLTHKAAKKVEHSLAIIKP